MKITCESIDDFLRNLDGAAVWNSAVYAQTRKMASDKTLLSTQVILQASALLETADGGQVLLLAGEDCGRDRDTADGGRDGSSRAEGLLANLRAFCGERGWSVMPGALDE